MLLLVLLLLAAVVQGDFPNAWKAFRGRLGMLRLNNIAALTGCVPLDAQNVDLAGTILDVCNFDEEKQVQCLVVYQIQPTWKTCC